MFSFCTTHYAWHKIVLELGEAKVSSLPSVDFEAFSCGKGVVGQLIGFLVIPSSGAIVIVLVLTIVGIRELKSTKRRRELNVDITVTDVFSILIITVNRKETLNVNGGRTNVALHREILAERNVRLGHVHLARILEVAGRSGIHLKALAGVEGEVGNEFIRLFVVPTSRAIVIILILAIVRIARQKSSKRTFELDVDFTITNIITLTIDRNEFGKFKTAAADCIERADLLRQELPNALRLIADDIRRLNRERTYSGNVSRAWG